MMYDIPNKNSRFTYSGTPEKEFKKKEKLYKLISPPKYQGFQTYSYKTVKMTFKNVWTLKNRYM